MGGVTWFCLIGMAVAGIAVGFVLALMLLSKIAGLPPW